MVSGSVDSAKVRELEQELNGIRTAFKDYIHNTREIESGFGQKLGNMHNQLANSATANDDLAIRLQTMAPVLGNLEKSLGESKKKLQEESRLRREMEAKLKVTENKHQAMRQEFDSLRVENGALREELDGNRSQWEEFHSRVGSHREMRESRLGDRSVMTDDARRSDNDTISAANLTRSSVPLDDSYLEVLEELETVTEQLISTQQKLWITEDKLMTAESQVEEMKERENKHAATEEQLLAAETRLRELEGNQGKLRLAEARMHQLENQMASDEALHARVQELERELVAANNHIQYTNEMSGSRIEEFKTSALAVRELQTKLEEATTQNEMLVEQVAHLQQHIAEETARSEATTMMEPPDSQGDYDPKGMRRTIDELSQENTAMKTKIIRLENNSETVLKPSDQIFELKDEIETLQYELTATKDKHRLTLLENDAAWRKKLEKARGDNKSEIQAIQMASEGKDKIVQELQQQINTLCRERDLLEQKVIDLESSRTIWEREHSGRESRNMQDQLLSIQKEKTKLELGIQTLKNTGQASAVIVEEMKAEQDIIAAEVKAMEAFMESRKGETDNETRSENDLIDRVRRVRKSLENSKLKPQEGDLKRIEELRDELDSLTVELAASKAAQKKLRRALDIRQGDEIDDIPSHFHLRKDGNSQQRNPYARDPEPNEGINSRSPIWMSNKSITDLHAPSHLRRDPPSKDSQHKKNDFGLRWLLHRLENVEEGNHAMKNKIEVRGGDGNKRREECLVLSNRDAELRKETIRQIESYLQNEKSGKSGDGVDSDILLLKLTAERQDLQEQLAELKLAVSTSESAKNQSEEELNFSRDEISRLQDAVTCLKEAISKLRNEYNKILKEAEEREQHNRSEIAGFATQLNELFEANKELEGANASKAEEIQTLTDEISAVKDSLDAANERYKGVTRELESTRQMVEDARKTAEQQGREIATAELRAAMREEREKERKEIQAQLDEEHRENIRLRQLMETVEKDLKDTVEKSERWQHSSEKANKEVNDILEGEKRLKLELEALSHELVVTRDELDFANASLTRRRADMGKLKRSKSFGLLSAGRREHSACKHLRDQIQHLISQLTVDRDSKYSRKTEGLQLKSQLMDIDMSVGKIVRENIMLEEELEYLNNMIEESREAAEKKGRREATRQAWSEIRERHENEIRDFKDQFSSLVEENRYLETQLRKYEKTEKNSNDAPFATGLGNGELRKEVELSNLEAKTLSQECLKLRLAMESMKDEHEQVVEELTLRTRRESDGIVLRLQNEVKSLRSEISEMQEIADKSRSKEKEYRHEIKRLLNVLSNSQRTLEKVNEERQKMKEAMDNAKSSSTEIIEKLRSKLLSSSQEIAELSSKVSDLTLQLDERKKDLELSRQENRDNKKAGRQQVHNLHINSNSLLEYTNELEATLKLSREEVAKTKAELVQFKNKVQSLEMEVQEHLVILKTTKAALAKERLDSDQAIKVLEAVNNRLNSLDGMTSGHDLGKTTDTTQMAERLEWRVEKLISLMQDSKRVDKREHLKLQMHAETNEMKFNQAKQEASRLENEVSRLLQELTLTKNKLSTQATKETNDRRPKPEIRAIKTLPQNPRGLEKLPRQPFTTKTYQRVDPEPRCTMESDIISEVVSMKSMESTDYMAGLGSEWKESSQASKKTRSESVDIRSEADCMVIDVDRYQSSETRSDPPSQGDLQMDSAIYHV